jgi:hypothetical protein
MQIEDVSYTLFLIRRQQSSPLTPIPLKKKGRKIDSQMLLAIRLNSRGRPLLDSILRPTFAPSKDF